MFRHVSSGQIGHCFQPLVYIISGHVKAGCRYLVIPSLEAATDDNVAK